MEAKVTQYSTSVHSQSKAYAFLLAILPVILMYKAPGLQIGMTSLILSVGAVFAGFIIVGHFKDVKWFLMLLLSLYLGYAMTKSSGINVILPLIVLVHVSAISTGIVNDKSFRKIIELISLLASACVIIQQIYHFLGGGHIVMITPGMLIEDLQDDYFPIITTGMSGTDNMYRPCAFFLEPAHFTQYVMFGLGSFLFRPQPNIKNALFVSAGLFATTSGMGFVITFAIWGWWYLLKQKQTRISGGVKSIIFLILGALILLWILSYIPFFQSIINRFIGTNDADYNAIEGRLFFWNTYFEGMRTGELIYGFGEDSVIEGAYMTGFMKVLYVYGIIGFVFLSVFLLALLKKVSLVAKAYVLIYIGLLFLANLTGFIPMIFNFGSIFVLSQSTSDSCLFIGK